MGQTTLNQKTSDFGAFGRYTEIPVDQMTSEQRKGYELVVQERGEAPGPPRGAGALRPRIRSILTGDLTCLELLTSVRSVDIRSCLSTR
jgi:hypothetical protein